MLALVIGVSNQAHGQGISTTGAEGDAVIQQMQQAYARGDRTRLSALLPQASGHVLEPWAAYWELKARLETATEDEVQLFLRRWPGTYQEDRLRNDWLLLLGKRRDFANFMGHYAAFRMRDDRNVRCYALAQELVGSPQAGLVDAMRQTWQTRHSGSDDACDWAAGLAFVSQQLSDEDLWQKARLAINANQPLAARNALQVLSEALPAQITQLNTSPARFLASPQALTAPHGTELSALALIKLASTPDQAMAAMQTHASRLPIPTRDWVWASIARHAALDRLDGTATLAARQVSQTNHLPTEWQEWLTRIALRGLDWPTVQQRIEQMPATLRQEPIWTYWLGRAHAAQNRLAHAQPLWRSIAKPSGDFYEKLAAEALGQSLGLHAAVAPPSAQAMQEARQNAGLQRALYAIRMGLRSEGNREWNYQVSLHTPGGMSDAQRHAAATLACEASLWDRCINTSERIRSFSDASQRFPMPFREAVITQSRSIGLDPAYVYGLIRQESRFVIAARSHVGAQGLMQVMPATGRWTARRIGLTGYRDSQLSEMNTNILLGTHYLKIALDDFQGATPMAAAAYNAGPGRPRQWRNGPTLEGAIWAETIPFTETRNYVKAVLANTVDYHGLITGQPRSLLEKLGQVGPLPETSTDPSAELPSSAANTTTSSND